jgi:c(7)-type cytochrome triheme protein
MEKIIVLCLLMNIAMPFSAGAQSAGGGDITFSPKGAKKVVFSHKAHLRKMGSNCNLCRFAVFQMKQDSYEMNMSKITKGEFCGICHNGDNSFDVKDKKNCAIRHKS